jgi:hypothetical protein
LANTEKTVTFLLADGDLNRIDQSAKALNDMGFSNILQAEDGPEAWSMFKISKWILSSATWTFRG